ncbi:hypothetical protein BSW63_22925 [Salmonella enterica subsp. enterica serovar Enteritidis]|nr:hypothetical protein [Salmonella enterica subsp. enterica serovar Enteritidis]
MSLRIIVDNCIKLLGRPAGLSGTPAENGGRINWKVIGSDLLAINPTPFYMNLSMIKFGSQQVSPDYVAPYSERFFSLPKGIKKDPQNIVTWKILTDVGTESQAWSVSI